LTITELIEARERWESTEADYQQLTSYPEMFSEDERVGIITARNEHKARYLAKRAEWHDEHK